MEIRPSGAPIDDPFFAVVRRRHPDVDLVVLPPEAPDEEPVETVDDATVDRATELVEAFADGLWVAVAPRSQTEPGASLRYGDRESEVQAVARVVDRRDDGYAVLVRLRHELELRGWTIRRPPGALERLTASLDGGRLMASYAEETGVVVLELSSAALPVGIERARELVG
jgi:hypothetical protein